MNFITNIPFVLFILFTWFSLFFVISQEIPTEQILTNVQYGSNPEQIMDIYLPGGRDPSVSKVIVLVHGGGWSVGSKEDLNAYATWFLQKFPRYGVANLNYRLGSLESPGYPKQLDDIQVALEFLKTNSVDYQIKPKFGLVGFSAGAHLSMLYGYGIDKSKEIQVICNMFGPSDLTDPSYADFDGFNEQVKYLVGNVTYDENPLLFSLASPGTYVTNQSPPTISFYGDSDPIVPPTQWPILEDLLDIVEVDNKMYLYAGEGHGFGSNSTNLEHHMRKLEYFFKKYL